jgi:DNA-directed RNA polymerase subunit RPC12/RpoP
MYTNSDMFADLKPKRSPRRRMMHVCDAGDGCYSEEAEALVKYSCRKCGHETDWEIARNVNDAKRGIPCPLCN